MKQPTRKALIWTITCVVLSAVSVILLLLINTVLRDWFIISYGVRAFNSTLRFVTGCTICTTIFAILCSIPVFRSLFLLRQEHNRKLADKERESEVLVRYAADSSNPEFTRQRLLQIRSQSPNFANLVDRCLEQMDHMDRLQEKQRLLIETNDALFLKDTVAVLDKVETRICQNFRSIVNLCIISDDPTGLEAQKIDKIIGSNEERLNNAQELLKASAAWINQYNTDKNKSDRSEVETWITVIRDSLKEDD